MFNLLFLCYSCSVAVLHLCRAPSFQPGDLILDARCMQTCQRLAMTKLKLLALSGNESTLDTSLILAKCMGHCPSTKGKVDIHRCMWCSGTLISIPGHRFNCLS